MSSTRKLSLGFDSVSAEDQSQSTVLIVDDHVDSLFYVQQAIEIFGYSAVTLEDGERAVEAAKRCSPVVILLDICLKGITGFEVIRRLKDDADTAHIPVIAATAMVEEPTKVRALASGFDDFLAKPYTLSDLETVLDRHALTKARSRCISSELVMAEMSEAPAKPIKEQAA